LEIGTNGDALEFSESALSADSGSQVTLTFTNGSSAIQHNWVMVKAARNTPEALLAALKAGSFYSSTGPEIYDIRRTRLAIEVDCSRVQTITVAGKGIAASTIHGQDLTTGAIALDRFAISPWIRVTVIDQAGKRAWSNPIWLDD